MPFFTPPTSTFHQTVTINTSDPIQKTVSLNATAPSFVRPPITSKPITSKPIQSNAPLNATAPAFIMPRMTPAEIHAHQLLQQPQWLSTDDISRIVNRLKVQLVEVQALYKTTDAYHCTLLEHHHTKVYETLIYYSNAYNTAQQFGEMRDFRCLFEQERVRSDRLGKSVNELLRTVKGVREEMRAVDERFKEGMEEVVEMFSEAKGRWERGVEVVEKCRKVLAEIVVERDREIEELWEKIS